MRGKSERAKMLKTLNQIIEFSSVAFFYKLFTERELQGRRARDKQ